MPKWVKVLDEQNNSASCDHYGDVTVPSLTDGPPVTFAVTVFVPLAVVPVNVLPLVVTLVYPVDVKLPGGKAVYVVPPSLLLKK